MSTTASSSNGHETSPLKEVEGWRFPGPVADPCAKVREGLGHLSDAAEKAHARTDRAELQRALESLPQAAVSEADLHKTPWHHLGWEFALNLVASLVMAIAGEVVLRFMPPLPFQLEYVLVPVTFILVFGLTVCLVDVFLAKARNPHAPLMAELPLLQAIVGRRILTLQTASEVFIFAHTLERKPDRPGVFVGLVANPQDPAAMRKILRVGDVEVLPGNWKATLFYSDARDYSAELQKAAEHGFYPSPSQVVERWLFEEKDGFKVPCVVVLRPANGSVRFMFLWRHWAVRICFSAVILFTVTAHIVSYLVTMHRLKHRYCEEIVIGDRGEKFCQHLLDWMGKVALEMGVEEIEIIWTACLAVVLVYSLCLLFVRCCHEPMEKKVILASGITSAAMAEVLQVGRLLDDRLSVVAMVSALRRQSHAYFATLRSCQPMVADYFKSPSGAANPCFQEVMKPVKDMLSGKATHWLLHLEISKEEHYERDINGETRELQSWAVKVSTAAKELSALKNSLGLTRRQSVSRKDCMFSVAVPITCWEALDIMKHWMLDKSGPQGYADQIKTIFSVPDCQDSAEGRGAFCHVTEDFRVGPLFVPAGLCLTHICCETPDMDFLSLQVGLNKDVASKELLTLLFSGTESAECNKYLSLESFRDRFHWPPIILPSAAVRANVKSSNDEEEPLATSDMLSTKLKDTCIDKFYFIFQLSPSYFKALRKSQQGDVSLYGFAEGTFTRLSKSPVPQTAVISRLAKQADALKRQSWKDTACSEFRLVAEEDKANIYRKICGLCGSLALVFALAFACLGFVLIVPCFRRFKFGRAFPHPFTGALIFNTVTQFFCLFCFFWIFTRVTRRLALVSKALSTFEAKSLAPCLANDERLLPKDALLDRGKTDPFRLYVARTRDYDPSDERWAKAFRQTETNLLNWQRTACWLRLFVSGSRLTSQAVLVGAAAILLVMLLVDVSQALSGTGAFSVNDQVVSDYGKGLVSSGVHAATNAANGFVEGQAVAAAKAATSRRLFQNSPDTADLSGAAKTLAAALAPIEEAVERVRQRQLFDLSTALTRVGKVVSVGDVQQISQAQLLTIFMTVFLLFYTCFLLSEQAFINDHVNKHASILIQVKEQQLQKQSIRDKQAADMKASGVLKEGSTEVVEQAQRSYNKTLDILIRSTHANRSRFPLALFSFIITQGLLMAWLCAAVQPLVAQLSKVVPHLAVQGCQWLGNTAFLSSLEHKAEHGMETAFHQDKNSDSDLFYSLVCESLLDAMNANTEEWNEKVEEGKHANDRRLLGAMGSNGAQWNAGIEERKHAADAEWSLHHRLLNAMGASAARWPAGIEERNHATDAERRQAAAPEGSTHRHLLRDISHILVAARRTTDRHLLDGMNASVAQWNPGLEEKRGHDVAPEGSTHGHLLQGISHATTAERTTHRRLLDGTNASAARWSAGVEERRHVATAERNSAQWRVGVEEEEHAATAELAEVDRGLLLAGPSSIVEAWWDANPGNPDAKLAIVRVLLAERARRAQKLLAAGPEALLLARQRGVSSPGPLSIGEAWWTANAGNPDTKPALERAVLKALETGSVSSEGQSLVSWWRRSRPRYSLGRPALVSSPGEL